MKAKIWKKNAVLATVILFVCVAVYLNWHYGEQAAENVSTEGVSETAKSDVERIVSVKENLNTALTEDGTKEETLPPETDEPSAAQNEEHVSTGYFATARLSREQARDESIELLRQTVLSEGASQDVIDAAYTAMSRIADNTIAESQIEGLVMAKGFSDCVAYISDEGVNVIVSASDEGLNSSSVTQIKDIVISETGVSAAAIKIFEAVG